MITYYPLSQVNMLRGCANPVNKQDINENVTEIYTFVYDHFVGRFETNTSCSRVFS